MTTLTSNPNLSQLTEHIQDWRGGDVVVDRTQRTVSNIALTGLESANGYRYSERALGEAIPLYQNKPVFLDHARNQSRPFERSTRDLVGMVVNPRFEDGRVRGNIQTLDTEAGRTFVALAESKHPSVGMSHVVLARRNPESTIVEKIEEVVSIDAVIFPATASTFQEQQQWAAPPETPPGCIEAVQDLIDAALPHHVRQIDDNEVERVRRIGLFPQHVVVEACCRTMTDDEETGPKPFQLGWSYTDGVLHLDENITPLNESESSLGNWEEPMNRGAADSEIARQTARAEQLRQQIESLQARRDKLRSELETHQSHVEQAKRRQRAEELIRESGLPPFAVTDHWKQQVLEAADEAAQRVLIEDRLALLGRLRVQSPDSVERRDGSEDNGDERALIAAIRGSRGNGMGIPA